MAEQSERKSVILRVLVAIGIAAAYALVCYALIDWTRPDSGFVAISFVIVQPAAICAFVCYVGDPLAQRRRSFYLLVPVVLLAGMIVLAIAFLQEGAICIAMLAPVWLLSGEIGSYLTYRLRTREPIDQSSVFLSPAMLALPLVMMPLEAMLPVPEARYIVSREIVIDAPAARIWPLMEGIPDLREVEGQWNLTQDLLGVPRPLSAKLVGKGPRSVRLAKWERGIAFREVVTRWAPEREIHWRFDFAGSEGWQFTDRHLRPDGASMRILDGGYTLTPLADGRHKLRLETRYAAQTHVNAYASLWGELFLGDLEANLLAAIRDRAEVSPR